tara:strand:- start:4410 stop:4994 length:585 start_codon:yes stop_codon:yes gene_type:complete
MPTSASSNLDITNRALILVGASTITAFTDSSEEAIVTNALYEDMIKTLLTSARWRFASKQVALNESSGNPIGRFDRSYTLPSDYLMLHAITVNDLLIEYNIYGTEVFANTTASDSLIADYTFRQTEGNFPSYFIMLAEYSFATMLATSLARDEQLGALLDAQTQRLMQKAKTLDAQQQTTKKLVTSRFLTDRRN